VKPRISVVIPTHDRAQLLEASLASLTTQTLRAAEFEVVVVNDGSIPDTAAVCERAAESLRLKHVPIAQSGIAAAKNMGLFAASAPIVLFFDDDDVADPGLLEAHLAAHDEHPEERFAVLGHTTWAPELEVTPVMNYVTDVGHFLFSYSHLTAGQELDYTYFWGGRSSAKRLFLAQHGVFAQCFTFGCEDIELGYRLARHGLRVIYRPDAASLMIRPLTFDQFCRRCERQGRAQLQFSRMHPDEEIRRYCDVDDAHVRWALASATMGERAERVRELEALAERSPRELEELHELYGSVFRDLKLKGIVEAASERDEAAAAETPVPAAFAEKWQAELARRELPSPGAVRRAGNRAAGKRILVVDHYLPIYDRASGARRLWELLRLLVAEGHAVTFVARDGFHGERYVEELEALGIEVHCEWNSSRGERFDPIALLRESSFDLAFVSFFHVAERYLHLLRTHSPATRIVVDTVDVHWVRERREAELRGEGNEASEATKLRELAVYAAADVLVAITDVDRQTILAELPDATVYTLPNVHQLPVEGPGPERRDGLLFVGNFNHTPNRDAALYLVEDVLPRVRTLVPDARLTIVGADPPPEIVALSGAGVTVTGYVPETGPYLDAARVSVAPLRYGAGLKGKIGEALAAGLPVVTSSVGAEGMELADGEPAVLVGDDPDEFAAHVAALCQDDGLWRELVRRGRAHVEERYSPATVAAPLSALVAAETASPNEPPLASIVILVHNQLALTRACLESIERHTPEPHEVILVDNGSTDETAGFLLHYAQDRPHVRLVANAGNRGYSAGNNQGLALANGRHVVFLNNDTVVTPGWLSGLVAALERHPQCGLVGPMTNRVSGPQLVERVPYTGSKELVRFASDWREAHAGETAHALRLVGFCLLAKRAVIERIGGFDERFGNGNLEDDDLCLRAAIEGFGSLIAGDVFIHHEGGQTFQETGVDHRQAMVANWGRFKEKWKIPAETALGDDYEVAGNALSPRERYIPVSDLSVGHRPSADGRIWEEDAGRSAYASVAVAVGSTSVESLRRAFAEVRPWDDVQRRYEMRKRMIEMVLAAPSRNGQSWMKLFVAAADELVAALEEEPREPVLLNYAGVLLYELAQLPAAEDLFRAALRLDPELPHVDRNLAALRKQRQRRTIGVPKTIALESSQIAARARAVAAAARPVEGLKLSLCMIVRDEEEMLPGCLAPVHEHVDEIVVVDTGSSDRTVEIARSFGARVLHFPWNGSFADARNLSIEEATGDWIVYLDADEHMLAEDAPKLRDLLGKTWREGFHLVETNYTGGDESGPAVTHMALRLFRNRPEYRFEGRIHEQKTQNMPTHLPERFESTQIRMLHYGYLKGRVLERGKSQRNLELLEREAAETQNPFTDYNLGCEYVRLGDAEKARVYLERSWSALGEGFKEIGYGPTLTVRLGGVRRATGDLDGARYVLERGLAEYPEHTDLVLELALCARDAGAFDTADQLADRCLRMGDGPAHYIATVGAGTFLPLSVMADARLQQGDAVGAEQLWRRSLEEHPGYLVPVLPLVGSLLRRGVEPAEAAKVVPGDGPLALLLLATACHEAGFSAAAETWFRRTLEKQPGNGAARVGLAEALLSQRRYEEAAAEAALEPEGSLVKPQAALSELFARAAVGEPVALASALDRAARVGLPDSELGFYRAWAAALSGDELPEALPQSCAPATLTALEALLRVGEFELFETVLRVFDQIELQPRDRREVLASLYLRRGFLDSAAEEWLAAAHEEPDGRSFVGLAQVAFARGFADEALELVRGALDLEPANAEAARMALRLQQRLAA